MKKKSFHECVIEYRKQLVKGYIKTAYSGLMKFIMDLKTHFEKNYPENNVSSGVYYGFMDVAYFTFAPEPLKKRKLKMAVLFNHNLFRFEIWLAGVNKQIQGRYQKLFRKGNWNEYHIPADTKGVDSIMEYILAENPDFSDLTALTANLEKGINQFSEDVKAFLSEQDT